MCDGRVVLLPEHLMVSLRSEIAQIGSDEIDQTIALHEILRLLGEFLKVHIRVAEGQDGSG